MRHYITALLITVITLVSCSSGSRRSDNTAARNLGERHAKELVEAGLSDAELQFRLLEIRSNETAIREDGYNDAADAYIEAFTDYIKAHNDSLARVIF